MVAPELEDYPGEKPSMIVCCKEAQIMPVLHVLI